MDGGMGEGGGQEGVDGGKREYVVGKREWSGWGYEGRRMREWFCL